MAISLVVSETRAGSQIADVLAGTANTGIDFGQSTNGAYAPLVDQGTNDGAKNVHIRHNAVVDPITDFKTYIQTFSGSYGGADTAANDFATLKAKGNASSSSDANNDDGLGSGLHVDMDWDVDLATQFAPSRIFTGGGPGDHVAVYGDANTDGIDLASAVLVKADAMYYDNGATQIAPTVPVLGKIGISTDAVLGNACHLRYRFLLEQIASVGGILQFDIVWAYAFTA